MSCILCDEIKSRRVYSDDRVEIIQCINCGLVRQSDYRGSLQKISPNYENIDSYYQTRNQNKPQLNKRKAFLTQDIRRELIERIRVGGKILDVGCGRGEFLVTLQQEGGFNVVGLEPNIALAQFVREMEGISVVSKMYSTDLFPENTFDAITFIQVFEHLEQPLSTLAAAYKNLNKGGVIVIDVPSFNNPRIFAFRLLRLKALVRKDFIPAHCYYYTRNTLSKLVEKSGFKVEKIVTGRYVIKSGINNFAMRSIDRLANYLGIGGITLYARKT